MLDATCTDAFERVFWLFIRVRKDVLAWIDCCCACLVGFVLCDDMRVDIVRGESSSDFVWCVMTLLLVILAEHVIVMSRGGVAC